MNRFTLHLVVVLVVLGLSSPVLSAQTEKPKRRLPLGPTTRCVSLSPDGKVGLSTSGDRMILWSLPDGKELRTFEPIPGKALVIEDEWDPTKFDSTRIVDCLATDWKMEVAVTGDRKGMLRAWNLSNGKLLYAVQAYKSDPKFGQGVTALTTSSDGAHLFSSGREPGANIAVKVWGLKSGKQIKTFAQLGDDLEGIAYERIILLNDGKRALLEASPNVWLWDLAGDKQIWLDDSGRVDRFVAASDDGSRMLTATLALVVRGPNGEERRVLQEVPNDGNPNPPVRGYQQIAAAFPPKDSTRALTAGTRGDLTLWDVEKGKALAKWSEGDPVMRKSTTAIAFSGDGKFALVGSDGNSLQLWEVASGKMVIALKAKQPKRQEDKTRDKNVLPK